MIIYLYMHLWAGSLQESTSPSGQGVCLGGCCRQLPGCTVRWQWGGVCSLCGMNNGGWFAESGNWASELIATIGRLTFEEGFFCCVEHHCWSQQIQVWYSMMTVQSLIVTITIEQENCLMVIWNYWFVRYNYWFVHYNYWFVHCNILICAL